MQSSQTHSSSTTPEKISISLRLSLTVSTNTPFTPTEHSRIAPNSGPPPRSPSHKIQKKVPSSQSTAGVWMPKAGFG
ncbi:hypothetical protein BJX70DRAFT_352357 [Aspergillus crustosus]